MKVGEFTNVTGTLVEKEALLDGQHDRLVIITKHEPIDFEDAKVILVKMPSMHHAEYAVPKFFQPSAGIPTEWVFPNDTITHDRLVKMYEKGEATVQIVVDGEGRAYNPEDFEDHVEEIE